MKKQSIGSFIKEIVVIFLVVMGIRFTFYGLSRIPSESMVPTANIGDFIAVANFPYGFSPLSIPYTPSSWATRWLAREPEVGDVIVIRVPHDQNRDYIKRLIGLPGDRIQMKNGILHINGKATLIEEGEPYSYYDQKGKIDRGRIFYETLPNGVRHKILKVNPNWGTSFADNTPEFIVPEDHYFLMGDNRDRSMDSRFSNIGFIHKKNLIGRADLIWFSTNARSLFDITNWVSWSLLKERLMKRISP
jgi:signal peptidase I